MKIAYVKRPRGLTAQRRKMIEVVNSVIEEYTKQGYELTLRQAYYQLVARGFIENSAKSYDRLTDLVKEARLQGLIDWEAIVDRTRNLRYTSHWENPESIIYSAAFSYHVDKWLNQKNFVEVWIEKDALIDVIARPCKELDVSYFSTRGCCSQSEMWRAANRFKNESHREGCYILHLADHDPSGIDMTRDIADRMKLFGAKVNVRRFAEPKKPPT